MKVLIVDDSAILRSQLREQLSQHGYQVFEAHDGEAATKLLDSNTAIQVILSDVHMPNKGGFELAETVRANPNFASTKIFLMSADKHTAEFDRCQNLQISGIFTKPINIAKLLSALAKS